jgi:uncharacterized membrane protein
VTSALSRRPGVAAVAGALTIAFSAILVKLADVEPSTAAIFRCAYALPVLWLIAHLEDRRFGRRPLRERRIAIPAGIFFAADLIFWHHAIGDVGAGLATVLGNLQVVVVPFAAWALLSERVEGRILAALPLICSGVVLISGVLETGAYGDHPLRGVLFGLLTGLSYAGFLLVLRQAGADLRRPAGPLFDATFVATIAAVLAGLAHLRLGEVLNADGLDQIEVGRERVLVLLLVVEQLDHEVAADEVARLLADLDRLAVVVHRLALQPEVALDELLEVLADVELADVLQIGQALEEEDALDQHVHVLHLLDRLVHLVLAAPGVAPVVEHACVHGELVDCRKLDLQCEVERLDHLLVALHAVLPRARNSRAACPRLAPRASLLRAILNWGLSRARSPSASPQISSLTDHN